MPRPKVTQVERQPRSKSQATNSAHFIAVRRCGSSTPVVNRPGSSNAALGGGAGWHGAASGGAVRSVLFRGCEVGQAQ